MTKMFTVDGKPVKTINPITGCLHDCVYCWAKNLAEKKLHDSRKYRTIGFAPTFHPAELQKSWGKNNTYFVVDMGDMWGDWVPYEWITAVLDKCERTGPSNTFLFLTKNPCRYVKYFEEFPLMYKPNYVLGATIESDLDALNVSKAPPMYNRYAAMTSQVLKDCRKFISIEPIQKFIPDEFARRIITIKPEFVYVGVDNYNHGIPTPDKVEIMSLVEMLKPVTDVRLKTIR